MPWAGSEPTIPAFEQVKKVHVLDRAATAIGWIGIGLSTENTSRECGLGISLKRKETEYEDVDCTGQVPFDHFCENSSKPAGDLEDEQFLD
jgi:hypothetical protein